jgi:hypothetical protein
MKSNGEFQVTNIVRRAVLVLIAALLFPIHAVAGTGDTSWMSQGDDNQFSDQELIDWIKTCNNQGGVCTLDWPFDPQTGLLKDFGLAQLKRIARAVKGDNLVPLPAPGPK